MTPLDRIESKIDRLTDDVSEQKATLARNTASLEHHVKRTDLLEATILPLTAAHQRWVGAGKAFAVVGAVVAALGSLVAVTEGLVHVFGHLK